ncbi:WD40-repeat-containing domain protein [Acrodontium crateriforme]|uniref:WD40-repeat-containing domain protein n=1 Tax=Acrodontium crateriforme TaxID=150365 RepID=A0AAQ3LZC1_9PEZI|nr:WD40-repeat-containing domain protein [Acrodontium crateriforme]
MPPNGGQPDVFPSLYACFDARCVFLLMGCSHKLLFLDDHLLYDVKFYPFPTANNDPLFAVCGVRDTFLCRITEDADHPLELKFLKDLDTSAEYNSCVWTKHPVTQSPLLCLTGKIPKQIQIVDIDSGKVIRSLNGHGKGINDLAISPLSTNLLFSAAEDYTIRLWNLEPQYEEQPCVAVFAGEGHRQPILAINVHPNGRWMLSGSLDNAICLWAVPEPHELIRDPKNTGFQTPKTIYYPHFLSTEVHFNYVDCLKFHGDLIISRASRDVGPSSRTNEILLWKIEGFDSSLPAPAEPPVPSAGKSTRSSLPHSPQSRGFQRLLTFDMPGTNLFYQRFGLLDTPGMRPILAMGNQLSKFLFWDLQVLEEGIDLVDAARLKKGRGSRKPKLGTITIDPALNRVSGLKRDTSIGMSSDGIGNQSVSASSPALSPAPADRKYQLADPFTPIKPHRVIIPTTNYSKDHFSAKSIAFSPDGSWMVGVGDKGMVCVFNRDKDVVWSIPPTNPASETMQT